MRPMAFLIAALFLATHLVPLGAQEETRRRPQPMTPSEDATLAARAAHHPELASFTAGTGDGEALVYALVLGAIAVFSVFMGNLIGCPLGWTHSTEGRSFVPADCFKNESKTVTYLNGCGVVLGFHFYALGYLIGLAFPNPRRVDKPVPTPPEPVPDRPGGKE